MLAHRSYVSFYFLFVSLTMSLTVWAEETILPPPVHDANKALTEKNTHHQILPEDENVDLKKELIPDNIGKDVQIRSYVRKTDQAKISEYSMHGRVYMVKVQPAGNTPAYYLYDEDGDGDFSKRLPANYKRLNPPVWLLKKF